MEDYMALALRKLIHFPCDGRNQFVCHYEFDGNDLRFGKANSHGIPGFYCKRCFRELYPGYKWEEASTMWDSLGDLFESTGFSYNFSETMRQGIFTPKGLKHGTK